MLHVLHAALALRRPRVLAALGAVAAHPSARRKARAVVAHAAPSSEPFDLPAASAAGAGRTTWSWTPRRAAGASRSAGGPAALRCCSWRACQQHEGFAMAASSHHLGVILPAAAATPQEDKRLVELVSKHGNKWTLISQEIGGRLGRLLPAAASPWHPSWQLAAAVQGAGCLKLGGQTMAARPASLADSQLHPPTPPPVCCPIRRAHGQRGQEPLCRAVQEVREGAHGGGDGAQGVGGWRAAGRRLLGGGVLQLACQPSRGERIPRRGSLTCWPVPAARRACPTAPAAAPASAAPPPWRAPPARATWTRSTGEGGGGGGRRRGGAGGGAAPCAAGKCWPRAREVAVASATQPSA